MGERVVEAEDEVALAQTGAVRQRLLVDHDHLRIAVLAFAQLAVRLAYAYSDRVAAGSSSWRCLFLRSFGCWCGC